MVAKNKVNPREPLPKANHDDAPELTISRLWRRAPFCFLHSLVDETFEL